MHEQIGESLTGYYDRTTTFIIKYSEKNSTQVLNEIQFLNLNN